MKLPKQYNIRWNRSDYSKLSYAIRRFNKKIQELDNDSQNSYLPKIKNYQEVKQNINTRRELNRVLKSLSRFNREGAEKKTTLESGEALTVWEYKELKLQRRIAQRRMMQEINQLNMPMEGSRFSRAQMGSQELNTLKASLKSLSNLDKVSGYEFERLARRIRKWGTSDYNLKQAYVYQENVMEQLHFLEQNFPEFKKIYDYFNSIKNPITFYNKAKESEMMLDFFKWYRNPTNYAEKFRTNEDVADYLVNVYSIG